MTSRAMIDAGPGLNFCSINQQRLLIDVTGPLYAPQTVSDEVLRKASSPDDRRFQASEKVWNVLAGSKWLTVLADDVNNEPLVHVLTRIGGHPGDLTKRKAKDLGERMVVAHASLMVQEGNDVTVLIDDGGGQQLVAAEKRYLSGLSDNQEFGNLYLLTTPDILIRSIGRAYMPDKKRMADIYARLRRLDDGLMPIDRTHLLDHANWNRTPT